MKNRINRLRARAGKYRLALSVLFLSAWYRCNLLYVPFEKLARRIGTAGLETATDTPIPDLAYVRLVRRAVIAVCARTPWESKCLVQALVAKKLLNRKKLPCTLYMGVRQPTGEGGMIAHAWLRCGGYIIVGEQGCTAYTVTTVFGDPS